MRVSFAADASCLKSWHRFDAKTRVRSRATVIPVVTLARTYVGCPTFLRSQHYYYYCILGLWGTMIHTINTAVFLPFRTVKFVDVYLILVVGTRN